MLVGNTVYQVMGQMYELHFISLEVIINKGYRNIGIPKSVGRGGTLVETMTFNRRVVGLTPALAAT